MHHSIGRILGSPGDYRTCRSCRTTVWYEHASCHNCGGRDLRPFGAKDAKELRATLTGHDGDGRCDECEVEV